MGSLEGRLTRYVFSEEEKTEVEKKYPKIKLTTPDTWEGVLDIHASFDGHVIKDSFEIKIRIPFGYPEILPLMFEVGGRTQAIIEKYKMTDPRDLHINITNWNSACLCVRQEEKRKFPPGSTLVTFIDNLVVPYLYGLSFYDSHKKWPWGERAHGALGVLEFYAEDPEIPTEESMLAVAESIRKEKNWVDYSKRIRKPSPDKFCLCGKKKPFKKCHPDVLRGVERFNEDLKRLGLSTQALFSKISD